MRPILFFLIPFGALTSEPLLNSNELRKIGIQVWQNECRGTLDGLVTWNQNEDFPSLGIGHFIWYPAEVSRDFEEGFPAFISFLKKEDPTCPIPVWIDEKGGCPWKTRTEFLEKQRSQQVLELRGFLSRTVDMQFLFLYRQFEVAEQALLSHLGKKEKELLQSLKKSGQGIYALIDYVNFKGTGLSPKERYQGEGWGLLQVLQRMAKEKSDESLVASFVHCAKETLKRRVQNAPPERKEERWIRGWQGRLDTYLK